MKSWNWISATGLRPFIAMPIAVPTMPSSDSGVSKQRALPNSLVRPSVARNTPPVGPTSSPNTSTVGSRRMAVFSASLTAWTRVSVGIDGLLEGELAAARRRVADARGEVEGGLALAADVRGDLGVDV